MAQEVRATTEAEAAARRMKTILDGALLSDIQSLNSEGQRLSDPSLFNGPLAVQFRGTWTDTYTQLNNMHRALGELQVQVDNILRNIFTAGGR